ncbi:MAG: hypothetical protein KDA85_00790, partial [Planctomycetaceae bacterium]|nr:hypothetical protein [Planctomycetaceae bacterium]
MSRLFSIITSDDPAVRDRSLDAAVRGLSGPELLDECRRLDQFRRDCPNLYQRVRSLFFLYAIHRFHLPALGQTPTGAALPESGKIPFSGYEHLLNRRFPEAIDTFLAEQQKQGSSIALSSALAEAYHRLAFQTLADQVRRSVRTVRGNQWMFRTGHPADLPLRLRSELLQADRDAMRY